MADFLACSFTGHRHIKEAHKENIKLLVFRAVEYAYSRGCRDFFSGGAVGFDTITAQEVLAFRDSHSDVRLCLLLPCENQDEHWSSVDKAVYRRILSSADSVEYVCKVYTPTCMRERNLKLAERADILISYVSRWSSGSAQTVRMAERLGKEVYNLYPKLDAESGF